MNEEKKGKTKKANGKKRHAASSSQVNGSEVKKKRQIKQNGEEIPMLEEVEDEEENEFESEAGSIEKGESAMEWIIHPTSVQARIFTKPILKRNLFTSSDQKEVTTKRCFLPKQWRRLYVNREFYMENI